MPATLAVLAGTRPECLKLVSLIRAGRGRADLRLVVISSGQHPGMVRRTLGQWSLLPDLELQRPPSPISLSGTVRWLRDHARAALRECGAQALVVQGDTSTAYAGALAARAAGITLVHVEAGLRTTDPMRPFPEEMFRRRIGKIADWHYAPTASAADNLRREGVPEERIEITGNTGIDALRLALSLDHEPLFPVDGRLLVLTLHRRENYGPRLEQVCSAVLELLQLHSDFNVVCPVHPNPTVGSRMRRMLGSHPRIRLTEPLDYVPFVRLLARAALVITDSGGIQEEAPYLGVPVVVARENTERPEAVRWGATRLVAARHSEVIEAAQALLAAPRPLAAAFDADAPFGDGLAGARIITSIAGRLSAANS
ncbi:MAG TPA: UDP-N-acetylglucosamine 2-epimerase (non-hydrolyzing) [Xanthomonadales bacterium]|nr:UDP-N-acetylglucosamine 2-epimerase (non-hydrolyzing) [Xanthomonadales bacterium]